MRKQRCILSVERNHVEIDAVEKNILFILNIKGFTKDIISITQVTGRGVTLVPYRCLET